MIATFLSFLLLCTPAALLDHAIPIWKHQPATRVEDAYKWIFQATRGGEHAAPDRDSAAKWLDGEWAKLAKPQDDEMLWVPLCPDGSIGRLSLRRFKTSGGKEADLLDAFLASAREFRGSREEFETAWTEFGNRLKTEHFGKLTRKNWKEFDKKMRQAGYPAIHHSESYSAQYAPAYRVLTGEEVRGLIPF